MLNNLPVDAAEEGVGEEVLRGESYCIRHRLCIPPRPGSECYACFKEKLVRSLEELQTDLDAWLESYNRERPHSGRYYYGKTPWETLQASKQLALEKDLSRGGDQSDNTVLQITAVS